MSEVRLLHTADIHLDWLFESMPISKRQKRREELEAVFKHITNLAIEEGVDALLISGDLFHSSTVSDKSAALVKRQLASLSSAGIDTVIIAGNHDVGAFKGCFRSMTGEGINVLTEDKWECLHLRCGLEVWGRSWVKPADSRILLPELESALRDYGSSCSPRVVMHHGQVMLGPQSSLSPYMPFTPNQLSCLEAQYIALGHVHGQGQIPVPGNETIARYPGAPFRLSFGEASPRSVTLASVSMNRGVSIAEIEVPDRSYLSTSFSLNSKNIDEIIDEIKEMADAELCLQITLSGVVIDDDRSYKEMIFSTLSDKFFHLDVLDRTENLASGVPVDGTVRGRFVELMMDKLQDESLSDDDKRKYNTALRLGLSALRGGLGL